MKLSTYPKDGNQALRSSGLRYTRVFNLSFCTLTFAKAALPGFQPCELCSSFLFNSFHFFSTLFILFQKFSFLFLHFFFLFFAFLFSLFFVLFLALTFAWVTFPGFRPSEPLKGKSVAWSMSNGPEISNPSESKRVAAVR
ncbi:hypothetical protein CsSME_00002725 [Camellia sinensis var. sinensis]